MNNEVDKKPADKKPAESSLGGQDRLQWEFDLLIHESAELQENIRGNSDAIIKIAVFVMPLVSAAYLFALGEMKPTDKEMLAGAVVVVASLILLAVNALWSHNMMFVEYKYRVVIPRIYALCEKRGDSFGDFVSKGRLVGFLLSFWLCQAIVLIVISAFVLLLTRQEHHTVISYTVFISASLAFASSITTCIQSYRAVRNARAPVSRR